MLINVKRDKKKNVKTFFYIYDWDIVYESDRWTECALQCIDMYIVSYKERCRSHCPHSCCISALKSPYYGTVFVNVLRALPGTYNV